MERTAEEPALRRDLSLDSWKGVLICLVVLGHGIEWTLGDENLLFLGIYSFHMAAFFAVSGELAARRGDIPTGAALLRTAANLLVPALLTVLLTTWQRGAPWTAVPGCLLGEYWFLPVMTAVRLGHGLLSRRLSWEKESLLTGAAWLLTGWLSPGAGKLFGYWLCFDAGALLALRQKAGMPRRERLCCCAVALLAYALGMGTGLRLLGSFRAIILDPYEKVILGLGVSLPLLLAPRRVTRPGPLSYLGERSTAVYLLSGFFLAPLLGRLTGPLWLRLALGCAGGLLGPLLFLRLPGARWLFRPGDLPGALAKMKERLLKNCRR